MSYDFFLRIPGAPKRKRKGGPSEEQLRRLARARELLLAAEPTMEFDEDEGMFTARSGELGEVFVEYDRISLGPTMASSPRSLYGALHGLMQRFDGEGYEAFDPQHGCVMTYHADFAIFMRQYRSDFDCDDDEFAQWCRGETPPAWIERAEASERGARLAAEALRGEHVHTWQQLRDMADDALWRHLLDITARNDEAIRTHGLEAYLRDCSNFARRISIHASRRLDGSYYPNEVVVEWMNRSMLNYEAQVLGQLRSRRYPGCAFDRPQWMDLVFALTETNRFDRSHTQALSDLGKRLQAHMHAACRSAVGDGIFINVTTHHRSFHGDDVDAMFAAIVPLLPEARALGLVRVVRRYGEIGSREEETMFE